MTFLTFVHPLVICLTLHRIKLSGIAEKIMVLSLVFIYHNSPHLVAVLLWESTEGENDFRNTKDFIHRRSPTIKSQGHSR